MPKTVVMACVHRFDSPLQIAAQYLARQFVRHGWRVVYITAPVTPLHVGNELSRDLLARYRTALHWCGQHHLNAQLTEVIPFSLIAPAGRPLFRSKAVTNLWARTILPSLRTRLAGIDALSADLLYIDNIWLWPAVDIVQTMTSVFRIMDPHEQFPGWKEHARTQAAKVAQGTDGTLYSHPRLAEYANSLGAPRVQYHPNGVDLELFAGQHPRHPMFSRWSEKVAVYVGAVDYRLDFDLTARVAQLLPDWDFVLAGPVTARPKDRLPPNVHFPGPIPRSELPSFLKSATAGFLPYDIYRQRHRLQMVRPLKLLECLAAGLPVVCAHWQEVEKMGSPALLYRDSRECAAALRSCAENPVPPEVCRRFAAKRNWPAAFRELLDFAGLSHSGS